MGSVLVVFSGGIDSALVLRVATDVLGERAVGLTAVGPALAVRERQAAKRIAAEIGARHVFVESAEIDDPGYRANAGDRCWYCKSELYRITAREREALGLTWVANGTNTDDLGDHRPGLAAADEARVRSPLVEAGVGKDDVRAIARELGMTVWDKPASACLASRIPYGTEVDPVVLAQIDRAELAVKALGYAVLRVRHYGSLGRVELPEDGLHGLTPMRRAAIVSAVTAAGYAAVEIADEPFRSGSLNASFTKRLAVAT